MVHSTNFSFPLKVYMGKGKLWLMSFGCLIFIAIGGWFFAEYLNGHLILAYGIVGICCVMLFGACLIFFIRKLFDRSPALVIDYDGILDNSSYLASGLVRWEDIQQIELYQLAGQKMIGIQLKEPEAYLGSQRGLKRQLIQINQGMVQAPINIGQSALRMPLAQIYEEMMMRWHSHQGSRLS